MLQNTLLRYKKTHVVVGVVVVVGATTVLKAIPRERELLWNIAHFKDLWRQQ